MITDLKKHWQQLLSNWVSDRSPGGTRHILLIFSAFGLFILIRGLFSAYPDEAIVDSAMFFMFLFLILFFSHLFRLSSNKSTLFSQIIFLFSFIHIGIALIQMLSGMSQNIDFHAAASQIKGLAQNPDTFAFLLALSLPLLLVSNLFLS
jgi:hypothetical protein